MTVLATDWLSISINLMLVLFVAVCLLMSMIILMQRPKNEGLGAAFGSNTTDQLFGARTTNVLQKGTVYLASLFFVLTLALAVMIGKKNANRPTLVADATPVVAPVEEKPAPIAPEKPLEPEAVTPPVQVPVTPPVTPAPETTPPVTPAPGDPADQAPAEEQKPAEEAPPAEPDQP